jgi:hypothetical protein
MEVHPAARIHQIFENIWTFSMNVVNFYLVSRQEMFLVFVHYLFEEQLIDDFLSRLLVDEATEEEYTFFLDTDYFEEFLPAAIHGTFEQEDYDTFVLTGIETLPQWPVIPGSNIIEMLNDIDETTAIG